jgi:hypothetical protein
MRALLPLVPLLLLLACAPAASGGSADAGPVEAPMSLDAWTTAELRAACDLFVCFFGIAPTESAAFCGDEPEKRALRLAAASAPVPRLAFDPAKARRCLDGLALLSAACWGPAAGSDPSRWDALVDGVCSEVLVGTVPAGGACYSSEECATGTCTATASTCPGVCQPPAPAGASCASDRACAAGLRCVSRECRAPAGLGLACTDDEGCTGDLRCFKGSCRAPLAKGAACEPAGLSCEVHLRCVAAGAGLTCQDRAPEGAPCVVGASGLGLASPDCAGNQVCLGLELDADGTILVPGRCATPHDVGGACVPRNGREGLDDGAVGCFLGLRCDETTSRCVALPGPDAPCVADECNQAAFCDAGTCRALLADGAPCAGSSQCQHVCLAATQACGPSPATASCRP